MKITENLKSLIFITDFSRSWGVMRDVHLSETIYFKKQDSLCARESGMRITGGPQNGISGWGIRREKCLYRFVCEKENPVCVLFFQASQGVVPPVYEMLLWISSYSFYFNLNFSHHSKKYTQGTIISFNIPLSFLSYSESLQLNF